MTTEIKKAIRTAAAWAADQAAMEALYGVGGYYTTLSAWEAAEQADLVAADQIRTAVCYDDWPTGLSDAVYVNGWTTDATRYARVTVASGHRHVGIPQTGFHIVKSSAFSYVIKCEQVGTKLEFLDVQNTNSNGYAFYLSQANAVTIRACISRGGASSYAFANIGTQSSLFGCLAYGSATGYNMVQYHAPTLYNCVATGNTTGFNLGAGTGQLLRNCLAYGNTTGYTGTGSASCSNNGTSAASGASDMPGTSPVYNVASTDFINAAGNDFHLSSASVLRGAGVNLYSSLTEDVDGDPWPSSGAWDIGFDYFVSSGGSTQAISASGGAQASGTASASANVALAGVDLAAASGAASASASVAMSAIDYAVAGGAADISAGAVGNLAASGSSQAGGAAQPVANVTISAAGLAQAAGLAGLSVDVLRAGAGAASAAGNAALAATLSALASGAAQAGGSATVSGGAAGSVDAAGGAQSGGAAGLVATVRFTASDGATAGGSAAISGGSAGDVAASGSAQAGGVAQVSVGVSITAAGFVRAMGAGYMVLQVPIAAVGAALAGGTAAVVDAGARALVETPAGRLCIAKRTLRKLITAAPKRYLEAA